MIIEGQPSVVTLPFVISEQTVIPIAPTTSEEITGDNLTHVVETTFGAEYQYTISSNADNVTAKIPSHVDLSDYPLIKQGPDYAGGVETIIFGKKGIGVSKVFGFIDGNTVINNITTGVVPGSKLAYYHDICLAAATASGKQNYEFKRISTGLPYSLPTSIPVAALSDLARATDCWAAHWDFSGVPIGHSTNGGSTFNPQHGGALLTSRHLGECWHYHSPVGTKWAFMLPNGSIEFYKSIGMNRRPTGETPALTTWKNAVPGDIAIHTLDRDVNPELKKYEVPDGWVREFLFVNQSPYYQHSSLNTYLQPLASVYLDQNRSAKFHGMYANECTSSACSWEEQEWEGTTITIDCDDTSFGSTPSYLTEPGGFLYDASQLGRVGDGRNGDSGSGNFLPTDSGNLICLGFFTSPWSGSSLTLDRCNALIKSSDDDAIARGNLSSHTGLTVTAASDPTL